MVHAYNCTKHESTGQSPYFLMFGREPNLPVDIAFGLTKEDKKEPQTKYILDLRERLLESYRVAVEQIQRAQCPYLLKFVNVDVDVEVTTDLRIKLRIRKWYSQSHS